MLLGGINPTSVTTTVMQVGGVKSYRGFSISRFEDDDMSFTPFIGFETRAGANSFLPNPSNITPSLNLYVSQHTTTGTELPLAIIATKAVPAREYTAPLELRE